jgi:hypothetical protein
MKGTTDMVKALELKILEMCEKLLPKTTERSNPALQTLLSDIRKELEKP